MTDVDGRVSVVLQRLAGAYGEVDAHQSLERLASRIVERLAGLHLAASTVAIDAFAEQVALAVGRHLSSPRESLIAESTDVCKAMEEADDETGG